MNIEARSINDFFEKLRHSSVPSIMDPASTTPALMPPSGVRPDLQDPESLNPVIIGVSTLCLVLTTIMISVRVVTKSLTTREILLEDCE